MNCIRLFLIICFLNSNFLFSADATPAFRLLCTSHGPKPTMTSTGEPTFQLFEGPDGIYPVLFPDNLIETGLPGTGLPLELALPALYRSPRDLWSSARTTYNIIMKINVKNQRPALHAFHAASSAQVHTFQELMRTIIAYKRAGHSNSNPMVHHRLLTALPQSKAINPIELALLRELMNRHQGKTVETPILDKMEFEN